MRKLTGFISAFIMAASVICIPAQAVDISVAAVYDSDGTLVYSTNSIGIFGASPEESCLHRFVIPEEYQGMTVKHFGQCENAVYRTWYGEEAEAPWNMPAATEAPATEPPEAEIPSETAAPVKTPYPEVYEKALDAVNAPAIVIDVNETLIDGSIWYDTKLLYQGTEISTKIYEDAEIVSAPEVNSGLVGENSSALKAGDVIHFTCDLQGRVKSIEFIYRPTGENYAYTDTEISSVVGADRYSTFYFGVPIKTAKGYMELADKNGKITEIDLHPGTFVYGDAIGKRGGAAELIGTGYSSITVTRVQKDTVPAWADIDPAAYILVRTRNGTATDIIQFEN